MQEDSNEEFLGLMLWLPCALAIVVVPLRGLERISLLHFKGMATLDA